MDNNAGRNVRRLRRARGMSLDVLAGRAGMSKSFLSRLERGERQLDRRSTLDALATALDCSIADIIGQPFPAHGPAQVTAHASVPALRRVLHSASLGYVDPAVPVTSIGSLRERAIQLWTARRACDHVTVAQALPGLLADLHVHAVRGPETVPALLLLVEVNSAATFALRSLGYADLAWTAAEQCHAAAVTLNHDVAIAFADFTRAQASSLNGYDAALHLATSAADALRPRLGPDPEDQRVYGTLLLTAAWAAASAHRIDRVQPYVDEAIQVAERTGDSDPAGDRWQTYFGPSNTGIWRMSIAVEGGDGGAVTELARDVDLSVIDTKSRQAAYWTELGRGLAQEPGGEDEAAAALLRADRTAPVRTRHNHYVRAAVDTMLERSTRRAVGTNLRTLANRLELARS